CAEPGEYPSRGPPRLRIILAGSDAGAWYLFLVHEVRLGGRAVETFAKQRCHRLNLVRRRYISEEDAGKGGALQLDLPSVVGDVDRQEWDPVLGHGIHDLVANGCCHRWRGRRATGGNERLQEIPGLRRNLVAPSADASRQRNGLLHPPHHV